MKLFLVIIMIVTAQASAQPPGMPPDGRGMERIERFRKMRLIEMLELKEEQSARFIARMNESESAQRDLQKQKDEVLDKIERLIRNKADAKEYEKLFEEFELVSRKIATQRSEFFSGLTDLLSIEQRAKLLLFERRFQDELRDAMREVQKRRRGGRPEDGL